MTPIDWTDEVLDQVETHWAERLRPRLDGLTDDEYFWEPVPGCWSVRTRGAGSAPHAWGSEEVTWDYGPEVEPAPVTTIAWRLGHLVETLASTRGTYLGGPTVTAETFDYPATASAALTRLEEAYAFFTAGIRSLGGPGPTEPQGHRSPAAFADAPVARVMLYTSVEVFHHGAEICLLRDLYRATHESPRQPGDTGGGETP